MCYYAILARNQIDTPTERVLAAVCLTAMVGFGVYNWIAIFYKPLARSTWRGGAPMSWCGRFVWGLFLMVFGAIGWLDVVMKIDMRWSIARVIMPVFALVIIAGIHDAIRNRRGSR